MPHRLAIEVRSLGAKISLRINVHAWFSCNLVAATWVLRALATEAWAVSTRRCLAGTDSHSTAMPQGLTSSPGRGPDVAEVTPICESTRVLKASESLGFTQLA